MVNRRISNCVTATEEKGASHTTRQCNYNTEPSFDGIAQLWWKDLKTFEQSWSSAHMQEELINNLRAVIDKQAYEGMLIYEVRML